VVAAIAPLVLLVVVMLAPIVLRDAANRSPGSRLHAIAVQARSALTRVRAGLSVFRNPRLGGIATVSQLGAWALQCLSCWVLLIALGLDKHGAGLGAAAAVLFAVNITAVLPATPANLGVFQAACATVLHTGWHIGYGDGVAFGVILQAVEVTTAILMGMPALLKEGMSWREVRLRAMHSTPVKLPARPSSRGAGAQSAPVASGR
jgi:phosphatidylinositol alpha-mannosyltransferase